MSTAETLIANAMARSAQFAAQAAEEHRDAFSSQMQEIFGVEHITLNEPYLPFLLVRAELRYLHRIAKLEARFQATKSAAAYLGIKTDDLQINLTAAIRTETNRAAIETKQDLDAARQQVFGITQYQWQGGECPDCAPLDGQVSTWGEGPEPGGIHPNCQCSAIPLADGAGEAKPPKISGSDIADMALLLASLIPAVRAGRIAVAAVRGLGNLGRRVLGRVGRNAPKPDLSKRPAGVPKDWKVSPTKDGNGMIYIHPKDRGTYVKVQRGNPRSSQHGQRYDNVRIQKNGQSYDVNGKKVPQQSMESHIPLEDFKFPEELFK